MRAHLAFWPARILALARADIVRFGGEPSEAGRAGPPTIEASIWSRDSIFSLISMARRNCDRLRSWMLVLVIAEE